MLEILSLAVSEFCRFCVTVESCPFASTASNDEPQQFALSWAERVQPGEAPSRPDSETLSYLPDAYAERSSHRPPFRSSSMNPRNLNPHLVPACLAHKLARSATAPAATAALVPLSLLSLRCLLPILQECFTSLMADAQLLFRIRATVRVYTCLLGGLLKQGRHPPPAPSLRPPRRGNCPPVLAGSVRLGLQDKTTKRAHGKIYRTGRKRAMAKQNLILPKLGIGPPVFARVSSESKSGFGAFSHDCDRADPDEATLRAKRSRP